MKTLLKKKERRNILLHIILYFFCILCILDRLVHSGCHCPCMSHWIIPVSVYPGKHVRCHAFVVYQPLWSLPSSKRTVDAVSERHVVAPTLRGSSSCPVEPIFRPHVLPSAAAMRQHPVDLPLGSVGSINASILAFGRQVQRGVWRFLYVRAVPVRRESYPFVHAILVLHRPRFVDQQHCPVRMHGCRWVGGEPIIPSTCRSRFDNRFLRRNMPTLFKYLAHVSISCNKQITINTYTYYKKVTCNGQH